MPGTLDNEIYQRRSGTDEDKFHLL
ncbi:conserved protein of unknown function [Pseudomonas marincola]|uniref:Uncharacterized protein n=1 Tax=Pseudomonas marincola TaxID=437900 RepID=A0A653E9H2_9PSED|nr:conserved protein of unknown function [Pseudomonas marincola]